MAMVTSADGSSPDPAHVTFRLVSPWRDRDPSEAPPDTPFVIRLRAPNEGQTVINDHVQGEVTYANKELDDLEKLVSRCRRSNDPDAKKLRDSVRNAMNRASENIKTRRVLTRLHDHLQSSLYFRKGEHTYIPKESYPWRL